MAIVRNVSLVVVGAVSGVLAASLLGKLGDTTPKAFPASTSDESDNADNQDDPAPRFRPPAPIRFPVQQPKQDEPEEMPRPRTDPVVAQRAAREHFSKLVEDHYREPLDPRWAGATKTLLVSTMKALETDNHFKTTDIDCRDTTCVATLEWESRRAAEEEFAKVVSSHKYEANCEKGLSLPEPVPGETTVKVPLLLNCEGWKQAGSLAFRPNE